MAFSMMALWMVVAVAVASTRMPHQRFDAVVPAGDWNVTEFAAVPFTVSAPRTINSGRLVSVPAPWLSLVANCTMVPASIVKNAPLGTMMSPWTTYGLFTGVQV